MEPSNYKWENMGYTDKRQDVVFYIVMTLLALILLFAYNVQFSMQQSLAQFDNYEIFDCGLFHNSLPSMRQELEMIQYENQEDGRDEQLNRLSQGLDPGQIQQKIPHYTRVRYQKEAFHTWSNFFEPTNT